MNNQENDIPKYKKKKDSSRSNSKSKSNHKHNYAKCLITHSSNNYYPATYCTVCGKIGKLDFLPLIDDEKFYNFKRIMTNEEICNLYKDCPIFVVPKLFSKYVDLNNPNNK